MFVHATKLGQKEAERFICWGHWHGLPRLNLEADVPTVQLVGYQTSQKETQDLYHEVYLLKRLPSTAPCRPSCQMESWSWGRDYQCDEALQEAREAHWWALEAAHMLELNIDRLSQEVDGIQHQCPHSHSCHWGRSLDRCERSPSQHRWERHVTFCNPEERMPLGKRPHRESWGHLIRAQLERGDVGHLPT